MKPVIFIVPEGGLANRMRAIASAVTLGRNIHREVRIIWHKDNLLNADFGEIFNKNQLHIPLIETGNLSYNLVYEIPRKKNLFISGLTSCILNKKHIDLIRCENEKALEEEIDSIKKDVIIHAGIEFIQYDRKLLKDLFSPSSAVISAKDKILAGETPEFGVQIRRTDNLKSIKNSPVHLFESVVSQELAKNGSLKFFLATDSETIKELFGKKYPENIIMNDNPARRDTSRGIIEAAAEMYILAGCKKIYGSYWSSFSEVASQIGDNELEVLKIG